jgi:2-polyprenyl-3-methyl-5-hydroxy-6-metoxy-1,4-benzoquinol methylase
MEKYKEINIENTKKLLSNINDTRYKQLRVNRYIPIMNMIEKHLEPFGKEAKILDVGTRDGAFLDLFKEYGYSDLYGVDIYDKSIEIVKEKGYRGKVEDAMHLNLGERFDLIVMSHVLEHCPVINLVVKNANKHLKKNGLLFVEVPRQNKQKLPTKDGHYFCFSTLQELIDKFDKKKWKLLESFQNKQRTRLKVLLRKINGY